MIELKQLNNNEQVIDDQKNLFSKTVFIPEKDKEINLNMYDPRIWKGFPLSERFWFTFCCKTRLCADDMKYGSFLIDELINVPCKIDKKIDMNNKFITLAIIKSGTLQIEPMIIHPYVKISFVNLKTCKYLQKSEYDIPVFLMSEKNIIINNTNNGLNYRESELDFIPPLCTPPYDLRIKGESFAQWNEEFSINDDPKNIFNSNNIIFFELLDFNFSSSVSDVDKNSNPNTYNQSLGNFPIAWGYLKPVGYSQTYIGKYKIQLYKYKYKPTDEMNSARASTNEYLRTPYVIYEFNWIRKEKYQTFLEIELRLEDKPSSDYLRNLFAQKKYKNSVFSQEGQEFDRDMLKIKHRFSKNLKMDDNDPLTTSRRRNLLKRRKLPSEDCILPDNLLYKFTTSRLGCLTHEFSPDGRYLASACTELNSITTIKIFNVEEGILKYHLKGHLQLIHNLSWSQESQILISSSSDNNVSIWQIPADESNNIENLDYLDNEKLFKLTTINHPSYVYSTAVFPEKNRDLLIFATACFDGIVRLYTIDLSFDENTQKFTYINYSILKIILISEEFSKVDFKTIYNIKNLYSITGEKIKDSEKAKLLDRTVLDHRHPNALVFDHIGRLYIGDSLGCIHIWEVSLTSGKAFINKLNIISHKELEGDNINRIQIEPSDKKRLIVHSRDNCIRLIDISKEKPKVIIRYFGLKCSKTNLQSCISPDGQYLLSGSEDGSPYLWSLMSGITMPTDRYECKFFDAISHVSWNSTYNMFCFSGFGQEYPNLVYVHEKKDIQFDPSEFKIKGDSQAFSSKEQTPGEKLLSPMQDHISDFTKELKTLIQPQLKK